MSSSVNLRLIVAILVFVVSVLTDAWLSAGGGKCPDVCQCRGKSVDCSGRNLAKIPTSIPSNTRILQLSNNKLKVLDITKLRKLTSLRELRVDNNFIQTLTLDNFYPFKNLRYLGLASNQMTSLPKSVFAPLRKLQNLDISSNTLEDIDGAFPNMQKMSQMYLSSNNLNRLTHDTFRGMSRLQYLDLANNNISQIDAEAFHDLTSLQHIILRENPIENADHLFVENSNLKTVDLANTQLQSVPQVLPLGLETLHLEQNSIVSIRRDALGSYTKLRNILLIENKLASIEDGTFGDMTQLAELWLNVNNLQQIPVGLPTGLRQLHLDNNEVSAINSNGFPANSLLETLSLQTNAITGLSSESFNNLASLQTLYLGGNRISVLTNRTFSPLANLQTLSLLRLDLDSIEEGVFYGLSNLTSLDCSFILVAKRDGIKGNIFEGLSKVKLLSLQESPDIAAKLLASPGMLTSIRSVHDLNLMDNSITSLRLTLLQKLKQLRVIKLPGNPFHCDLLLRWLQDFIKLEENKFFMPYDILCETPIELRGHPIVNVPPTEFVVATTTTVLPTTKLNQVVFTSNTPQPSTLASTTSRSPDVVTTSDTVNTTGVNSTASPTDIHGSVKPSGIKLSDSIAKQEEEMDHFIVVSVATSLGTATIIILVAVAIMVVLHRRRHEHDFDYRQENNELEFYVSDGSDRPPVKLTREEKQSEGSVTSTAEEDITNELDLNMRVYTWDDEH